MTTRATLPDDAASQARKARRNATLLAEALTFLHTQAEDGLDVAGLAAMFSGFSDRIEATLRDVCLEIHGDVFGDEEFEAFCESLLDVTRDS